MIAALWFIAVAEQPTAPPLAANRTWEVLGEGSDPEKFAKAASLLGDWTIELAGVPIDGPRLAPFGQPSAEPLLRRVREDLGRPVDVGDFLLFLDDVLAAGSRRGERFHVHSGRARDAGILLHPDDVFLDRPRQYGAKDAVAVDLPVPQPELADAAPDGSPPGPGWTARYRNPDDETSMLAALVTERPDADFEARVRALMDQLREAGADVYLASTARSRERGYLMWGAFQLSRATSSAQVEARAKLLDRRNGEWKLDVPIVWRHPDGWKATIEAARAMADSYDVVYATEHGARESNHYGGTAVDVIAVDLPRRLTLTAPDGATRSFDLADPSESRDLSLTPRLITWIEEHYGVTKLLADYPHWDDVTEE
jgi:hypothetical protein